jgi:DNA primase
MAILVESPANCWRLAETEIHNSVALFGVNFSSEKQLLLDQLGVTELVLLLDNDEAGKNATKKIIKECSNYYNIRKISLEGVNDVAELKPEEIRKLL